MASEPADPSAQLRTGDQPPRPSRTTRFTYKSLDGLTTALTVALVVSALLHLLDVIRQSSAIVTVLRVTGGSMAPADALALDVHAIQLILGQGVTRWVTVILLFFYLPRANRNARSWGLSLRFSPGGTVGWFFVPFANLFKPYSVIEELWQAAELPPTPWQKARTPDLLVWWWGAFLMHGFVGACAGWIALRVNTV